MKMSISQVIHLATAEEDYQPKYKEILQITAIAAATFALTKRYSWKAAAALGATAGIMHMCFLEGPTSSPQLAQTINIEKALHSAAWSARVTGAAMIGGFTAWLGPSLSFRQGIWHLQYIYWVSNAFALSYFKLAHHLFRARDFAKLHPQRARNLCVWKANVREDKERAGLERTITTYRQNNPLPERAPTAPTHLDRILFYVTEGVALAFKAYQNPKFFSIGLLARLTAHRLLSKIPFINNSPMTIKEFASSSLFAKALQVGLFAAELSDPRHAYQSHPIWHATDGYLFLHQLALRAGPLGRVLN